MKYTLEPTPQAKQEKDRLLKFFDNIRNPTEEVTSGLSLAIRREFMRNFQTESSGRGPWPSLSPFTIRDRIQRGYFAGPILVRTGSYRESFTVSTDKNHITHVKVLAKRWTHEEGVHGRDRRFVMHEMGTPRIPQRSVTILSVDANRRIANRLTELFLDMEPGNG